MLRTPVLLCLVTCALLTQAQTFEIANGLEVPSLNTKKLKPIRSDLWRLPGYALQFSNAYIGLGSDREQRRVLVTRYPETDIATGYFTITPETKNPMAEGPASFLSPNGMSYRGGTFRQNRPHGDWVRVVVDTLMEVTCPALSFDVSPRRVVRVYSQCYRDSVSRRRIRVTRATYRDGKLDGLATQTLLSGDTLQVVTYRSGQPIGEERVFDYNGQLRYTVTHAARGSDTTHHLMPTATTAAFKVVEQMPGFRSPACPTPSPRMSVEEHEDHKQCATEAMLQYIYEHIHYPKSARRDGFDGISVVTFVVEKDGSLTGVRPVRFVSASLDAEACRVVEGMPRWWPGYQNGEPVRVQFNLPIKFKLE